MDLKQQIIQLEENLFTLEVRSSKKRLVEFLSEDFQEIGASGDFFGLNEVLSQSPAVPSWSIKTKDYQLKLLSDDIVILTYRAFIRQSKLDTGTYSLRSSIWKKQDEGWKMTFHQGTIIKPTQFK